MAQNTIKRLEELVKEISGCFEEIPEEIYNEINQLTGSNWSQDEYLESTQKP